MSMCVGATYCGDPAVPERLGPALVPLLGRGLLAPHPHGGSAPRCATRALAPARPPTRAPLRLSLGAPTKPSWPLDPVSSKRGTAHSTWQLLGRCVLHAAAVTVPSPPFVGTCSRPQCYHPFPPRPHPLLRALLGAGSFSFRIPGMETRDPRDAYEIDPCPLT